MYSIIFNDKELGNFNSKEEILLELISQNIITYTTHNDYMQFLDETEQDTVKFVDLKSMNEVINQELLQNTDIAFLTHKEKYSQALNYGLLVKADNFDAIFSYVNSSAYCQLKILQNNNVILQDFSGYVDLKHNFDNNKISKDILEPLPF